MLIVILILCYVEQHLNESTRTDTIYWRFIYEYNLNRTFDPNDS